MPTLFVGVHLALISIVALFGLSFIADPCGGGGDLCVGGVVGLWSLGAAAFGGGGIVAWLVVRRASPLLLLDCVLVALAGYLLLHASAYAPVLPLLGVLLITTLGVPAMAMAGRAVATHRIERLLATGILVAVAVFGGEGGVAVLVLGLLALGAGWIMTRNPSASSTLPAR